MKTVDQVKGEQGTGRIVGTMGGSGTPLADCSHSQPEEPTRVLVVWGGPYATWAEQQRHTSWHDASEVTVTVPSVCRRNRWGAWRHYTPEEIAARVYRQH